MSAVVRTTVRGSGAAGSGHGEDLLRDLACWLAAGWGPPPARQSRPASAAEARRAAAT